MFNTWDDIAIVARQSLTTLAGCDVVSFSVIMGRASLERSADFQKMWRG